MADDPYTRLKSVAERGRLLRAIAAHAQLAIVKPNLDLEPAPAIDPAPLPESDPSLVGRVRWLLHHRSYEPALVATQRWVALEPDNGLAHYLYGRSLLGLGRLTEARVSFERTCTLQPALLEALLLRCVVDRKLKQVRATVGVQPALGSSLGSKRRPGE